MLEILCNRLSLFFLSFLVMRIVVRLGLWVLIVFLVGVFDMVVEELVIIVLIVRDCDLGSV